MGDRVSISFKDNEEDSVCLFHHWGGTHFPKYAFEWFKMFKAQLKKETSKGSTPTTRFEPRTMMVQFVSHMGQSKHFKETKGFGKTNGKSDFTKPIVSKTELSHSIYFGKDSEDGDGSDNGHYTIDVNKCEMINENGESIK